MEILVRQDFSADDIKKARLKAAEYRKSRATSEVSNLLNFIDLKRQVILCDSHARKLDLRAHKYRKDPRFARVVGNCDVCQRTALNQAFISEAEWMEVQKQEEQRRVAREYATIVS